MLNMKKTNTLTLKKSDYYDYGRQFDEVKWRKVIGETVDGLINAGYVCVVRREDCDICVIDYNYADRDYGDYYPVWLLPEEEESVVYEEYKEEERYTREKEEKSDLIQLVRALRSKVDSKTYGDLLNELDIGVDAINAIAEFDCEEGVEE